jgi:hypothetical protein
MFIGIGQIYFGVITRSGKEYALFIVNDAFFIDHDI